MQGGTGGAAFFMSGNETDAMKILNIRGSRYVITDYPMATTKFWAIAMWNNSIIRTSPYIVTMKTAPGIGTREIQTMQFLTPAYFNTMVSRLQLFDGSRTEPAGVVYVEYQKTPVTTDNPTIRFMKEIEWKDSEAFIASRAGGLGPDLNTALLSRNYTQSSATLPALRHFRLLYESPETVPGLDTMHRVKIFEYVKGAHIKGDGVIELQIITNTGRIFAYRQESSNGEFIVPYSTINNPYDVQASGKYHIIGINKSVDVSEDYVIKGKNVKY